MADRNLTFSVASVVEDVLHQHGSRCRTLDLDSRKAEEAALRRNEAASWLRKMVGNVVAKDLPEKPSEEELRVGLRSGIILCNVLNKVQPGAVPKVVESPCDSALIPDGAALSAYQYFENVRNFLVAGEELGLPTFEASDFEQGGKSARVVNCVLALKSYSEWKQTGAYGVWKFGGNAKPATSGKSFVHNYSKPFMNSFSKTLSSNEKSSNDFDIGSNKMSSSSSLSMLVRAILLDKKPEEIPMLMESVLSKVVEEFEHRITTQNDPNRTSKLSNGKKTQVKLYSGDVKVKVEDGNISQTNMEERFAEKHISESWNMKRREIFNQQQRDIQKLKQTLHTTKTGMQSMQMKFYEELHNLGLQIGGLTHAVSGYHRVLEENRKLYNQIQDLKGNIRVYCRVRPFLPGETNYSSTVSSMEEGTITINASSKFGKGHRSFTFNRVFGASATQAEVFEDTRPLIRSVLDGYNVCIFAYGQTGSGKTYTMVGPKDLTEQSQGVNYRALSDLFLLAEQRRGTFSYDVSVQMIEIYNEQVRDLLVTDGSSKRLDICNSSQTGLNVPSANLVPVSSTHDVIYLMNLGQKNRVVGATALNDRSSRSHSCLTVHVQGSDLTSGTVLRGCMHLVDLAGSERVDKSEVTGDRLKEAQHINKSLSALGDVIASLAQKNPHVPYRNSKLTQLLQDSLGGRAKTLMFVHISPEHDAIGETISTLKFAERVATVQLGAARVNKDSTDVKQLKEQIASLKAALAKEDGEPETYIAKDNEVSPFHSNSISGDFSDDRHSCRQLMKDVGNIEVHGNSQLKQKKLSFDLDEQFSNSPSWSPLSSTPSLKYHQEDDKEMGSGEWEDKVMVNRQDIAGCWETENGHRQDTIYQKYLPASSKIDQPCDIVTANNHFDTSNANFNEDVASSASSEPEMVWQFKHPKLLPSTHNGAGSKIEKVYSIPTKSPELRKNLNSKFGPASSERLKGRIGTPANISGRQALSANGKPRPGKRK